jgi:di/tricarboxylate transporter
VFTFFQAANCAYVIIIMAVYWMTEALPMAVTALLPIALMPWLDVSSSKRLCANYLKVMALMINL